MNDTAHQPGDGPSHRWTEVSVAVIIVLFGLITIIGSLKVGIGWGAEGPKSGFFPFYVGVAIILASLVNLAQAYADHSHGLFAQWGQLRQVMAVVIPTAVYVLVIPYTGIYVASVVLIVGFMMWLGKYKLPISLAVGIGVPIALFLMFEKWFLVPLPKGPLEAMLGL
jgi:putative tricarboxylic transport membrane protein